jgi:Xaa-Pro aminopeptidase
VLEPGMVINVDMPYTEIGWGSLHLEDTVLVTDGGHELLTTADLDLRCVPV